MAVTFRINQMRNGVGVSGREESSSREDSGALAPSPMTLRQIFREANNSDGSIAPLGFGGRQGTVAPLRLHTCMDKQTKSKHFRGASRAEASRRPRTVILTKR